MKAPQRKARRGPPGSTYRTFAIELASIEIGEAVKNPGGGKGRGNAALVVIGINAATGKKFSGYTATDGKVYYERIA